MWAKCITGYFSDQWTGPFIYSCVGIWAAGIYQRFRSLRGLFWLVLLPILCHVFLAPSCQTLQGDLSIGSWCSSRTLLHGWSDAIHTYGGWGERNYKTAYRIARLGWFSHPEMDLEWTGCNCWRWRRRSGFWDRLREKRIAKNHDPGCPLGCRRRQIFL